MARLRTFKKKTNAKTFVSNNPSRYNIYKVKEGWAVSYRK